MLPIQIKFINLYNYEGIYFLIAIMSALIYFTILAKMEKINLEVMFEAIFISLIAALVCGRLFSLIFWEPQVFFSHPLIFFKVWEGGITVTGGVMGGLVTGYIYARVKKLHFFYHIQIFVPPIIIGHIIGRFGCFLNGDAAGTPTNLPWGIVFDPKSVAYLYTRYTPGTPLHPTQLYEIFGNLILFLFIILTGHNTWISKRRIIWYAMGYSMIRFIVEFFRNDGKRWEWIPFLTTGQLITFGGFILGLAILIWSLFNDDKLNANEENIARIK